MGFRFIENSFRERCRGVVSIFLCLVISPFLTLAGVLAETARSQEIRAAVSELVDNASLSGLSDYDPYLHDRFGLFAISQTADPAKYTSYFNDNRNSVLGSSGKAESSAVYTRPLLPKTSDEVYNAVLRQQLADFSEETELVDFLLSDLNIEELIGRLDSSKGMEVIARCSELSEGVVSALKELVEAIADLQESVNIVTAAAAVISSETGGLAAAASEDVLTLLQFVSAQEISIDYSDPAKTYETLQQIGTDFYDQIRIILEKYSGIVEQIMIISGEIPLIRAKISTIRDEKLKAVREKIEAFNELSESDAAEDPEQPDSRIRTAAGSFQPVLEAVEKQLEEAFSIFEKSCNETVSQALQQFSARIRTELSIDELQSILYSLSSGDLSDKAQRVLKKLLTALPEMGRAKSFAEVLAIINSSLFGEYTDLISILYEDFSSAGTILCSAVQEAQLAIEDGLSEAGAELFGSLVTLLESLFALDVFYKGDLNAYLDPSMNAKADYFGWDGFSDGTVSFLAGSGNPYLDLLKSIEYLLDGVRSITSFGELTEEEKAGLNVFEIAAKKILKFLEGFKQLFLSVLSTVQVLISLTSGIIDSIREIASWISSDRLSFYEFFLLSLYMTDNLPSRVTMREGDHEARPRTEKSPASYHLNGTGRALTGFLYRDLPTPDHPGGTALFRGLTGLESFLENAADSAAGTYQVETDMFYGAELEYIIAGTSSELFNQIAVFLNIFLIRVLLNIGPVLSSPEVQEMASAAAVAAWIVYLVVLLGDSLIDSIVLVNGGDSFLVKRFVYLTPEGMKLLVQDLADAGIDNEEIRKAVLENAFDSGDEGDFTKDSSILPMNYGSHILISMCSPILLTSKPTVQNILYRFSKLSALETAAWYRRQGLLFDPEKTYTCIETTTMFQGRRFMPFLEFNGGSLFTDSFVRDRTY